MPIDYNSILETIQQELINYYTCNPHPRGNGKSTQFEKAVERIAKRVFAEYDRTHGLPEHYHVVEYLGGTIFPDIIVKIGITGEKVGIEVKYHDSANDWKTKGNSTYAKTQVDGLIEIHVAFGKFNNGACYRDHLQLFCAAKVHSKDSVKLCNIFFENYFRKRKKRAGSAEKSAKPAL